VLKARSKKISLVLVLAMLMTMFAGLGTASAATGYSATHVPLVKEGDGQNLGTVVVTFDNLPATGKNEFIIKLPAGFEYSRTTFGGTWGVIGELTDVTKTVYGIKLPDASIIKPGTDKPNIYVSYAPNDNQALVIVGNTATVEELKFYLELKNVKVPTGAPEEINAMIIQQPGSPFQDGVVQVAKTESAAVTALAGDPVTITAGGIADNKEAVIYFRENKDQALKDVTDSFRVKLPRGFKWVSPQFGPMTGKSTDFATPVTVDDRTLRFDRTGKATGASIWVLKSKIEVDESVAVFGDVEVTFGGASSINPSSVIIGQYADYGVEIVVDDPEKEVLAGRNGQKISDFSFKELIGESLLNKRTIYVELPSGIEWTSWSTDNSGGVEFESVGLVSKKENILKIVIKDPEKSESKGTLAINRPEVRIAGNFTGDITAKIWGNAGVSDEIVLGTVVPPISATAEVKDVKIGLQKQVAGNIVITETKAEAIDSHIYNKLEVGLPFNVTWGTIPTVEVIEGDIELGTVSTENKSLIIEVKNTSSKASKIEISDITYTVDRTVPEGDMVATFAGSAIVQTDFPNRNYVVKEVVANCVTPAPGETIGSGEFRIGSNIYYAGGVAKVMDVAPYIKGDRTYVPMRYLGEILGAEVVWDDAARTVTLTRGDITVVFTIGSTSYTVNGEAKTADVAPEITNDRTMLPARFVAEAFGAVVGWDAASQTVLIQK
jgi:hypothetical protein